MKLSGDYIMFVIYNILISALFLLFLPLSLLFVFIKAEFAVKEFTGRLGFYPKHFNDYIKLVKKEKKDLVWIHAASLGEIKMATTIMKELNENQVNLSYIVSTNSSAGRQMAERLFGPEKTILIPLDLPWIIKSLVGRIKPKVTILVEFEARPNFIYNLSRIGSKIILLNGSMDNKILKDYVYFPGLLSSILSKLDFLGMKTEEEVAKVRKLRIEPSKIKVTGNMKMENSLKIVDEQSRNILKERLKIPYHVDVIIIGSTHSGEEELIFKIYQDIKREIKDVVLILAPRHIERTNRIKILGESYQLKLVERTKIDVVVNRQLADDEIIILDTIGELAALYSIATVVFVGGSLVDKGGHNLFEPVVYGKPVLFGPYIQDFKESAELLLENQIAIMVKNEEELKTQILFLLKDKARQQLIFDKASELLRKENGLIKKNIKIIEEYLKKHGLIFYEKGGYC
jgi:3-deoxy-D-manno-octulosonic-acid transferase